MRKILLVLALLAGSATAQATEPSVLAPYRFQPAPPSLSSAEQQRALDYRNQVQNQLRRLELQRSNGPLEPRAQRRLLESRGELGGELNRMERVIGP